MYSESIFSLHKLVKSKHQQLFKADGGRRLEKIFSSEKRKQLETKVMEAFKDEVKMLSKELQQILADDLVTAFQNRMAIFTKIQSKQSPKCR